MTDEQTTAIVISKRLAFAFAVCPHCAFNIIFERMPDGTIGGLMYQDCKHYVKRDGDLARFKEVE